GTASAMASRRASRTVMVAISVPSGTSGSAAAAGWGGAAAADFGCAGARVTAGAGCSEGGADSPARCARAGCSGVGGADALGGAVPPSVMAEAASPSERIMAVGGWTATSAGPFRDEDLSERAFVGGLDLHGRLVGLDLGDDVAGLDRIALLLHPFGEVALLHRGRQCWHQDLDRHEFTSASTRNAMDRGDDRS